MKKRVLIVDDDPLIQRLFGHFLENADYEVLHAMGGLEGLKLLQTELVDVIVMDIMMADLDGINAIRAIKKQETIKNIPIIVVTSNIQANQLYEQEALQAGANAFMTKPFGARQLLASIERVTRPT
jgi:CheY-like chemotaxis protein